MRVAVDTNTLASGVLGPLSSPPARLITAWREDLFTLVISEHILIELERTLHKPFFAQRLSPHVVSSFVHLLRRAAFLAPAPGRLQSVATHPEDDRVLEAALTGRAAYLVTGDRKLQDLRSFEGVRIISPRQFLLPLTRLRKGGGLT